MLHVCDVRFAANVTLNLSPFWRTIYFSIDIDMTVCSKMTKFLRETGKNELVSWFFLIYPKREQFSEMLHGNFYVVLNFEKNSSVYGPWTSIQSWTSAIHYFERRAARLLFRMNINLGESVTFFNCDFSFAIRFATLSSKWIHIVSWKKYQI